MVYTAINVPYSAMMGVISADAEDRQELGRFRFLGAFGGGFLIFLTVRPLVEFLGKGDEGLGFQLTMGIFGILSILCFYICYKNDKGKNYCANRYECSHHFTRPLFSS